MQKQGWLLWDGCVTERMFVTYVCEGIHRDVGVYMAACDPVSCKCWFRGQGTKKWIFGDPKGTGVGLRT